MSDETNTYTVRCKECKKEEHETDAMTLRIRWDEMKVFCERHKCRVATFVIGPLFTEHGEKDNAGDSE